MKLAIMQPYLFPYIGYYQLAYHVDKFIFFDDVNYIKKGFINKNAIQTINGRLNFTYPVNQVSQNRLINQHYFSDTNQKLLATLEQTYKKSPYFDNIMPLIYSVINHSDKNVSSLASKSIIDVFSYLDIEFIYDYSSNFNYDNFGDGENKILSLCKINNASSYINPIGGISLYHHEIFDKENINLKFIKSDNISYQQFNNKNKFEQNLSMIDLLMNHSKEKVVDLLKMYTLN